MELELIPAASGVWHLTVCMDPALAAAVTDRMYELFRLGRKLVPSQ